MFNDNTAVDSEYFTYALLDKPFTMNMQGTGIYQCYCEAIGYSGLLDDNLGIC